MWVLAGQLIIHLDRPWATILGVIFIGAGPMHDILFHGHEGAHGRILRNRLANKILTWATHAIFGLSGSGYRAFHLEHHRFAHSNRDPEYRLMNVIAKGAPGFAWLAAPLLSYLAVNIWPFLRDGSPKLRAKVGRDLTAALFLHITLCYFLGGGNYLTFVVLPIFTSLSAVVIFRSLCEHHGAVSGDRWTNTRGMEVGAFLGFLWSNSSYHLEHHLYPQVPFHKLPELRRLLATQYHKHGSLLERGYLRTGFRLLAERNHFLQKKGETP